MIHLFITWIDDVSAEAANQAMTAWAAQVARLPLARSVTVHGTLEDALLEIAAPPAAWPAIAEWASHAFLYDPRVAAYTPQLHWTLEEISGAAEGMVVWLPAGDFQRIAWRIPMETPAFPRRVAGVIAWSPCAWQDVSAADVWELDYLRSIINGYECADDVPEAERSRTEDIAGWRLLSASGEEILIAVRRAQQRRHNPVVITRAAASNG